MPQNSNRPHAFFVTHSGLARADWFWATLNAHPHMLALHSYDAMHHASMPSSGGLRHDGDYTARVRLLQTAGQGMRAVGEVLAAHPAEIVPARETLAGELTLVHVVQHPLLFVESAVRWRTSLVSAQQPWHPVLDGEWSRVRHDVYRQLRLMPYAREDVGVWAAYQAIFMLGLTLDICQRGIACHALEGLLLCREFFSDFVDDISGGACHADEVLFTQARSSADHWRRHSAYSLDAQDIWAHWPQWQRDAFARLPSPDIFRAYTELGYDLSPYR